MPLVSMHNYVILRRRRSACLFSWCGQRDRRPLWPSISL